MSERTNLKTGIVRFCEEELKRTQERKQHYFARGHKRSPLDSQVIWLPNQDQRVRVCTPQTKLSLLFAFKGTLLSHSDETWVHQHTDTHNLNHIMDTNNNTEQEEVDAFNEALDPFVADVTSLDIVDVTSSNDAKEISVALSWFREAIYYNLPHGKRNRGLAVVMTHKILAQHYEQTPDLYRARLIGWCIEMLQTHFLILDDIMDESLTRRGQKCWHLKKNVGNIAINDSFFMQQAIFYILKKHFTNCAYFNDLITLFFDTMLRTTMGQCLDLKSSAKPGEIPDLDKFTPDKYNAIIDHKTAFYSFSAPVRLGMILSGLTDPHIHQQADIILRRMGQFFQVQDDYLDCFGDPLVMGKIGTDIEEGKCCWPIVTALAIANEKQRSVLEQNYARKDKQNVVAVKKVYKDLNIEELYKQYEMDAVLELRGLIDEFSKETKIPGEIFYFMLLKICGRQK